VGWTQYGDEGLRVAATAERGPAVAIPLKSAGLCGGSWNFPAGDAGEVHFRIRIPETATGLRVSLNDHFTRVDDVRAAEHAVFSIELGALLPASPPNSWPEVTLRWREASGAGVADVEVNGRAVASRPAQRRAEWGVHTLRLEFRATEDSGDVKVADLRASVTR